MKKNQKMARATGLLCGVLLLLLFGLVALGWLASPQKVEQLPVLLVSVGLLWGGCRLLRGGTKGRQPPSPPPVARQSGAEQPRTCASCGATDTPDENNCCQYCGAQLADPHR